MRLLLRDLQPGHDYAVQVRSDVGDAVSAWSPKLEFTATVNDVKPAVPQNVQVTAIGGDTFVVTWDAVTEKVNGKPLRTLKDYRIRVTSDLPKYIGDQMTYRRTPERFEFLISMNREVFPHEGATRVGFEVRAEDTSGVKGDYSEIIYGEMNQPDPPIIDSAEGIVDGIDIKWHSDDVTVTKYKVYIGQENGFEPTLDNLVWEGDATAYTYMTGTYFEHHIAVTALNDLNVESQPAYAVATPISPFVWDDQPPAIPTNFVVTPYTEEGKTGFSASWDWTTDMENPENDDLAGFRLRGRRTNAPVNPMYTEWFTNNPTLDPADNPFQEYIYDIYRIVGPEVRDTKVPIDNNFQSYTFELQAFDETQNGTEWVTTTAGAGDGAPPGAPTVNVRSDQSSLNFEIGGTLEADVDGGYGVWHYSVSSDPAFPVEEPPVTFNYDTGNKALVITGLISNTTYHYKVSVTDAEGLTSSETTGSVDTLAFPLPPGPKNGKVPAQTTGLSTEALLGSVLIEWDAVTTDEDGEAQSDESPIFYEVHGSTTTGFTPDETTLITQAGGTAAQVAKIAGSTIDFNTIYYFKVIAKDADGLGASSAEVSGTSRQVEGEEVESISAGKITTGSLASAVITMGPGGVIESDNYVAGTSGYQLSEAGLIIHDGTVSASAISAGTISGTTINVGAGGVINVDSTAEIKSNNYSAGSTGWRLGSTGLEINDGSMSASNITGGYLSAGIIYVSSGGGIYDANGYWSITPSSINIQNGSINAAAITSGTLRSNTYSVDENGNTNSSYWAWSFDKQGDAVLGNAYVRGRLVVGSGAIQSSYYYPGSSGWSIDDNGLVYFNNATISAGNFKSQNSGNRVELGDTGGNDEVDELRMWNSGTVSSIRNPSHQPGSIYISLYGGGSFTFDQSSDGHNYMQGGSFRGRIKFTTGGNDEIQMRTSSDGGYADMRANRVTYAVLDQQSFAKYKDDVEQTEIVDPAKILKTNGMHKWTWKDSNAKGQGLLADKMPEFLQTETGFDMTATVGFLWESLSQAYTRIEKLEREIEKVAPGLDKTAGSD